MNSDLVRLEGCEYAAASCQRACLTNHHSKNKQQVVFIVYCGLLHAACICIMYQWMCLLQKNSLPYTIQHRWPSPSRWFPEGCWGFFGGVCAPGSVRLLTGQLLVFGFRDNLRSALWMLACCVLTCVVLACNYDWWQATKARSLSQVVNMLVNRME